MHRHNSKYGHSHILKSFCGEDLTSPILGEIQHSLFLSDHHFNCRVEIGPRREAGRHKWVPLFSWSSLLPFQHQIPIGDPLIYDPMITEAVSSREGLVDHRRVVVSPKLNEELSTAERRISYEGLMRFAQEITDSTEIFFSPHPRDRDLGALVQEATGVQLTSRASESDPVKLNQLGAKEMARAALIVSDYFGAHVFRASAFYGTPVAIKPATAFHKGIHPDLRGLLRDFLDLAIHSSERQEISKTILGWENKREPEELREILFRPSMSPATKRIFVAGYKASRRFSVRLRQSALWGRSPVAKWWERRVLRPLWENRFPPIAGSASSSSPRSGAAG